MTLEISMAEDEKAAMAPVLNDSDNTVMNERIQSPTAQNPDDHRRDLLEAGEVVERVKFVKDAN